MVPDPLGMPPDSLLPPADSLGTVPEALGACAGGHGVREWDVAQNSQRARVGRGVLTPPPDVLNVAVGCGAVRTPRPTTQAADHFL